jgi:histone deacetylase 1/2
MEQPQGFISTEHPHFICQLHRSLYGLKQAPRAWFTRLSQALCDLGFSGSQVDYSLFTLHKDKLHIFILVYVNDINVIGNDDSMIFSIISQLQCEFVMKDLGDLSYFLGIEAARDQTGLHLRQSKYIADLLDRANMVGSRPYKAPCISGSKMSKFDSELLVDPSEYRHIIGALQYVTITRPNFAYSVNQLCQHLQAPTSTHWTSAKRVLRYLKHTPDFGLHYKPSTVALHAFCDADWASNSDDRRSSSGYGIYFCQCLVSWSSKKQPVVSRSNTEAEYRSLALTTAEVDWIRMLLRELHVHLPSPSTLWCDNLSAMSLASNPIFHARTKHIKIDYHFI